MTYNPEIYLESAVRELQAYVQDGFHKAVLNDQNQPVGEEVYEIIMEFPGPAIDAKKVPFTKTMVHFEIDIEEDSLLGYGSNTFTENYDPVLQHVKPQDAAKHVLNFDVGVWATDTTGGTTSRLRAKQILWKLLGDRQGREALFAASNGGDGGLEILSFSGGRFLVEQANGIDIYRMVDCTLEVRVFSRTPIGTIVPTIEDVDQFQDFIVLGIE
jgi:hypothetical protein